MIKSQPARQGDDTTLSDRLSDRLSALLEDARPRLLRLARLNGAAADVAEDIVQETLFEAWRALGNLREPERFDAWLDGICRNVCRRQARTRAGDARVTRLGDVLESDGDADAPLADLPDPLAFDPDEELEREDRRILLDRALGSLPAQTRALIELSYLAELPQREIAERLDMTLGALELRLHRARARLRQVLSGELRADAQSFGLLVDQDVALGWQEVRRWCPLCGQRRLRAALEPQAPGEVALRLRCPDCSARYGLDLSGSGDIISFAGMRSLLPAVKHGMRAAFTLFSGAVRDRTCGVCGSPVTVRLVGPHTSGVLSGAAPQPLIPEHSLLVVDCPRCGQAASDLLMGLLAEPDARAFFLERSRVVGEPEVLTSFGGQDAIRARLVDLATGERLTILVHPQTVAIMATLFE
ncbi:MAG TPA: sigma-70 family RNA polymerase sigma factor [Ktedonobacterales bacterium]